MKIKFAVIVFPGSNCDHDAYYALKNIFDIDVNFIWHRDTDLNSYDAILIPGGFSYGDYLRTGAIARFSPIMDSVITDAKKRKTCYWYLQWFPNITGMWVITRSIDK